MSFLCEDHTVEVHMQDIEKVDAIYEMVIYEINEEAKTVKAFFLDDSKQELHTVSFMAIAPMRGPLRNGVFQKGQSIEARYRVDEDSPWGWWAGVIHNVVRSDEDGSITDYDIEFEENEILRFEKHLVRSQSFL